MRRMVLALVASLIMFALAGVSSAASPAAVYRVRGNYSFSGYDTGSGFKAGIVATLTRIFGVQSLALAEDVVQDAFCRALEVWKFRGVPDNTSAWLLATA